MPAASCTEPMTLVLLALVLLCSDHIGRA